MKFYKRNSMLKLILLNAFTVFSIFASNENFNNFQFVDLYSPQYNLEAVKGDDVESKKRGLHFFENLSKKKYYHNEEAFEAACICIHDKDISLRVSALSILRDLVDIDHQKAIIFIKEKSIFTFENEKSDTYFQELRLAKSLVLQGIIFYHFSKNALDAINLENDFSKILGIYLLIALIDKNQNIEHAETIILKLEKSFDAEKYDLQQAIIHLAHAVFKSEETMTDFLNQKNISPSFKRAIHNNQIKS